MVRTKIYIWGGPRKDKSSFVGLQLNLPDAGLSNKAFYMKLLTLLFALFATLCFGCSKEEEDVPALRAAAPAPIVQVMMPEKTVAAGESVGITIHFLVNNGCGEFGSFNATKDGQTLTVKVYPQYRGEVCADAIFTREAIYNFEPESPGTYTLKFWAGDSKFTTKTLVVQ